MSFTIREVQFFDIKGISPQVMYDLGEFIRLNMINSLNRGEGVCEPKPGEEKSAYVSAGFAEMEAVAIRCWLLDHHVPFQDTVR